MCVRESVVRIVDDGEETTTGRSGSRRLKATIPALTVTFMMIVAVALSLGEGPVRAPSGTVVVYVYVTHDVGSDQMEQMLDRFGARSMVLDGRIVRPSLLLQAHRHPMGCFRTVAIRLLVPNVRDATAIAAIANEWYPSPDSAVSAIGTQHGDMGIPLKHCSVGAPSQ